METTEKRSTPERHRVAQADLGRLATPRVCMITHSKLNRDARVVRAIRSLVTMNATVDVICLANAREPKLPDRLEPNSIHAIRDWKEAFEIDRAAPRSNSRARLLRPLTTMGTALMAKSPARHAYFLLIALWRAFGLNPDIIHCHDLNVLPVGFALLNGRRRLIFDSHELFPDKEGLRFAWLWRMLERFLISKADRVIVTTESRAEVLKERYPAIPEPLVVRNLPELAEVRQMDIRTAAGLPKHAFVALYQGGVQAHRGLEQIILSCRELKDPVYVVIQGDGPISQQLCQLLRIGLGQRVRLLPGAPYEQMRRFTASADVGLQLLQPTSLNHTTALSNKLFEYFQAGLPVVASHFPAIREYVEGQRAGLVVDPENPREIARALKRLFRNRALRQRLANNARRLGSELCWEQEQHLLLNIYNQFANPSGIVED